MHRAALLLPISLLTLSACGDKDGDAQSSPTEPTDERTDPTIEEDDVDVVEVFDFALRPVGASPWTLDQAVGGRVTITLRGSATDSAGAEVPLEEAVAGSTFVVTLPNGEAVDAEAEVSGDDTLALTVELPAGLAPDGARAALEIGTDDAWITEAGVGLYADATARMVAIAGDPTASLDLPDLTVCGVEADDADDDGIYELLIAGVDAEGRPVHRGCVGFLEDDGEWVCEDAVLDDPGLEEGESLVCGTTDHFKDDSGGTGLTTVFTTSAGRALALSGATWTGTSWTGTGTTTPQASVGLFGVVLGINNTKKSPEEPISAMLLIRGDGGGGWTGIYQDGREPFEWTQIGTVTAKDVGNQVAWAGLFTDHDLTGQVSSTDPAATWAWSVDARQARATGSLSLTVGQWAGAAFANTRVVSIPAPDFTVNAAAAAGQDLDGDGISELVVEAWGEGQHAVWLVPSATDKAATTPVTGLHNTYDGGGGGGGRIAVRYDANGTPRPTSSMLTVVGGNLKMQNVAEMSLSNSTLEVQRVTVAWPLADALDPEQTDVTGEPTGVVGTQTFAANAAAGPGGRGICRFGQCYALPGYSGTTSLQQGGGAGDSSEMSTIAQDNPIFIGQADAHQNVIAGRAAGAGATPLLRTARARFDRVPGGEAGGGFTITADGDAVASSSARGRVAVAPDSAGEVAVFVFEPNELAASARTLDDAVSAVVVTATLTVTYTDASGQLTLPTASTTGGSTVPRLIDDTIQADGGLMLGWRDGQGQAWVGVLDVAAAAAKTEGEAPFLSGPVAVGRAVKDPEGVLPFDFDTPGMAGARQRPIADTPFLSMEDLEDRFSDWDAPMEVPFTGATGAHGPALMVVGDAEGLPTLVSLAAADSLDDLVPVTVVSGVAADQVPVPRISASLVPDAPQVVVCTQSSGAVDLVLLDGAGVAAWTAGPVSLGAGAGGRVSAGDLNGDGITDVVFGSGADALVVLSDGAGGALDADIDARAMTNFAVLLGGRDDGRECWDDDDKAYTVPVGAQVSIGASRSVRD